MKNDSLSMDRSIPDEISKKAQAYWKKDLVGVVLYGSSVKSGKYNDIDVLIVLKDIRKKRIDRVEDVVDFTGKLNVGRPIDVLLLSRKECADNFRNHNPLFLDIALDGVVVFDRDGFVGDLIAETRTYVKDRRIVRSGTAWFFPLKKHVEALSDISNADWAHAWIKDAGRDLDSAQALYSKHLFEKSVYHSALCVEKAGKAVLVCFGAFEKTHYISSLLKKETAKKALKNKELNELIRLSAAMEKHISLSRYPGLAGGKLWIPSKEYNDKNAGKFLDNADRALSISKEFIVKWLK